MSTKKSGAELVGSWTVEIGDQDEASEYAHTTGMGGGVEGGCCGLVWLM